MSSKKPQHKLSGVPTAYEEANKIVDSKDIQKIEANIEDLELERRKKDERAILELLNSQAKGENPMVKMAMIEERTFQEALGSLLSIKNTEVFETMMLLYEYMETNKTFKIDKLTGTELLKMSGTKGINQQKRHQILHNLLKQSAIKLYVLDPIKSLKNYKNKKEGGLNYKIFELLKISNVEYSEQNPELIVKLENVEFLPNYMKHIHIVSKRYIPLETIRQIPQIKGLDKSRHFIYKLCFKFAGSKKTELTLTFNECMNLGKFYNKHDRHITRKWKIIEKALIEAKKLRLIDYKWNFIKPTLQNLQEDNLTLNLFDEIIEKNEIDTLDDNYYKYIDNVTILRTYNLGDHDIHIPFELENEKATREQKGIKATF